MANSKKRCKNKECNKLKRTEKFIKVKINYFCDFSCAAKHGLKNKDKGAKIKHRAQKKSLKDNDTIHQHKLTQAVFNKLRVLQEIKWFNDRGLEPECISCGKTNMDWCCGHFKTRGSQGNLRYVQKNTYLQCNRYCNLALSGNINGNKNTRGYIKGLEDRFGLLEATRIIEFCESNTQVRKWSGIELKDMRKKFNKEIKTMLQ